MKLNDIFQDWEKYCLLTNSIDIVSNSVGKISKPYFDKKDVDTKAYEIEKLAEARSKEMKVIATAVKENFQLQAVLNIRKTNFLLVHPRSYQPKHSKLL